MCSVPLAGLQIVNIAWSNGRFKPERKRRWSLNVSAAAKKHKLRPQTLFRSSAACELFHFLKIRIKYTTSFIFRNRHNR